jgi:penicillin-binding protein 1A
MVVYLAALEAGMTPQHWVSDSRIRIGSWNPKNYKYTPRGQVTLQDAMAHSVNSVSARLAQYLGLNRITQTARRLGMNCALPKDLTIVLGTGETTALELTSIYAVIARGGLSVKPYAILKVTDLNGKVLYRYQAPVPQRLVSASVAQALTHMMRAVVSYGTGKKAALDRPVAGKTGTTQLDRDAWFIGFTPELVTGVWTGNDDNSSMDLSKAGSPSVRLWQKYMAQTPKFVPIHYTPQPSVQAPVYDAPPPQTQEPVNAAEPSGNFIDQLIDDLLGG